MKATNAKMISNIANVRERIAAKVLIASLAMMSPLLASAEDGGAAGGTFGDTGERVCGFFTNMNTILDMVSVVVVTLAVIIAGYQIAFAHKRMADVAPILIGGVLIGAASQIAGMLIGDTTTGEACTTTTMLIFNAVQGAYA